jgi:hypothetical protein
MNKRTALAWSLLMLGSTAQAGDWGDGRIISDKLFVSIGSFVVDFDTSAQAGSGRLSGLVEFEDDLDVDSDTTTARLDGFYRFNPKHSMDFGYFALDRDGTTILARDIVYDDVEYNVGAQMTATFNVDLLRLTYRYSFVNDGTTEAGFIAGLSTYAFEAIVDGQATVDDGMGGQITRQVRASDDVTAPIPVFGMFVGHAITPRWVLRLNAEFFDLESGDYAGRVVDTRVVVDYFFSKHVGIGAGLSTTDIDFSKEGENAFKVEYRQDGLLFNVSIVF